jgi:hypothetical protein
MGDMLCGRSNAETAVDVGLGAHQERRVADPARRAWLRFGAAALGVAAAPAHAQGAPPRPTKIGVYDLASGKVTPVGLQT